MPANFWVELDFFPSSGQAVTSGMFSCIFKLNTSLGNLFAHDYGCVPILLVVRPEVSQHYNLKSIGWNQVLVPKFWPLGEFMTILAPWDLCHQCPCPRDNSHPSKDTPRVTGSFGPDFYGVTVLCLVLVHMKLCVCFSRVEDLFQFYEAPVLKLSWPSKSNGLRTLPIARPLL